MSGPQNMPLPRLKQTSLCVLLALAAGSAMAAPGWDCQRGPDGKEWVCITGKNKPAAKTEEEGEEAKPSAEASKPAPVPETARTRRNEEPVPSREPTPPPDPEVPVETARSRPAPEPVAPAQPVPVRPPVEEPPPPRRYAQPSRPVEEPQQAETPVPVKPATPVVSPVRPQPRKTEVADTAPSEEKANGQPAAAEKEARGHAVAQAPAKTGWGCRQGQGKEWDCSLVGPDPRGEAHVVGEPGEATVNWEQSPDMTREDEQRFSSILGHMPSNPWSLSCGKRNKREWTKGTDFFLTEADRSLREKSPLLIESERAELVHGETSNFEGAAELARADQKLYGDFVTHNKQSGALNAHGNVVYREKGLSFSSDTAFMDLDTDRGVLRNSQFILETVPARGTSRITHIDSKTKTRYETATYTACPPGNQDWLLHAETASIDKDAGEGVANNAWLEFKGVPFLWTPHMTFPVDDRRKDGFLSPYVGYSKQNGFDMTVPYYFNLAPNYDFTAMPRYMSDRGELLRGDFRYLTTTSNGRVFADILPWDEQRKETRGQLGWIDTSKFTENISSHVDLHLVSDNRYIYELGGLLAINNSTFLRSWGTVNYNGGNLFGGNYSASILADYYQSLNPSTSPYDYPYRRMPQINLYYNRDVGDTGLKFQTGTEFAYFDQTYKVSGERINLKPRIYYPYQTAGGYITPSLSLQHTEYWLQNLDAGKNESSTFTRTAPIFSIDSGAYFERDFDLFDTSMQQTLEPRLFYLYVPKVTQPYNYNYGPVTVSDPLSATGFAVVNQYQGLNFDSNEYDFNFYQLFRENRYAGIDRLSDANNITPALTTRLINQNNGLERLKLSVGKVFYLSNPQVVLNPYYAPQTQVKNNIVGEASSMLSDHWSIRGTGQWNYQYDRVDRGQVALQYNNYANSLLNLSYRYRRNPYAGSEPAYIVNPNNPVTINQTDISTRLPIGAGWFAIGRWQYDIASQVTVQTMAGVERETCCWRFSLLGLRYSNGTTGQVVTANNVTFNNAVFFQLELKGLGRFGDQIDNLLLQNFSGYRTDYDLPSGNP
jgi:LPS-assembly protein